MSVENPSATNATDQPLPGTAEIMDAFNKHGMTAVHYGAKASHIIDLPNSEQPVSVVVGDEHRSRPLSGYQVVAGGPNGVVLVPEVTPLELNSSVSSNGKRMIAVKVPDGIDALEFRTALAAAYMQFVMEGSVTNVGVKARSGLSENRVSLILSAPEFRTACTVRGLSLGGSTGLSAEQDYALQIILDTTDGLTVGRKLKKAGISNSKWQAWLKNPLVAAHYSRVSEGLLNDSTPAILQLVAKANEGDLQAIKFMLEVNGRHNPAKSAQIDVLSALNQIMEVIFRNVDDHDALVAISGEMKLIGEKMGLTSNQRQINQ
jgi:hypothetical protein